MRIEYFWIFIFWKNGNVFLLVLFAYWREIARCQMCFGIFASLAMRSTTGRDHSIHTMDVTEWAGASVRVGGQPTIIRHTHIHSVECISAIIFSANAVLPNACIYSIHFVVSLFMNKITNAQAYFTNTNITPHSVCSNAAFMKLQINKWIKYEIMWNESMFGKEADRCMFRVYFDIVRARGREKKRQIERKQEESLAICCWFGIRSDRQLSACQRGKKISIMDCMCNVRLKCAMHTRRFHWVDGVLALSVGVFHARRIFCGRQHKTNDS